MKKLNVFIILILFTAANLFAEARVTPFNFSIFHPVSLFNKPVVKGFDVNSFYGVSKRVYGLQFNVIYGKVEEQLYGIGTAIIFGYAVELHGLQVAGVVNKVDRGSGLQIGMLNIAYDYFNGIQIGTLGNATNRFQGVQIGGFINGGINRDFTGTMKPMDEFRGLQIAMVNLTKDTVGVQIGILNYSENLKGIQIGIINIVKNTKIITPVMIGLNVGW